MEGRLNPPRHTPIAPRGVVARQSTDVLMIEDRQAARAVAFIRERACERIRVVDVLRHVSGSRGGFEPRFKQCLGRTIHQEIQRVQINEVKQLLATTELPLKRIARLTGFNHAEYMSRAFRRTVGQPPSDYRRQVRG